MIPRDWPVACTTLASTRPDAATQVLDECGVVRLRILASPISHIADSMLPGTVRAAIDLLPGRETMSDDAALAMRAGWGHVVDGTLEAVIRGGLTATHDFKRVGVVVAADLANGHGGVLRVVQVDYAEHRLRAETGFGRLLASVHTYGAVPAVIRVPKPGRFNAW
jgi:hypothetical protein